jgi:NAD+ synthase (glutamine-hydrolysing)
MRILSFAEQAAQHGCQVVVFPEMVLCGYPPEDLILKPHFMQAVDAELHQLAKTLPPEIVAIVGVPFFGTHRPRNGAAILHGGKVNACYAKHQLPNYGVFDECRIFEPGTRPMVLNISGFRIGLQVCEDSWVSDIAHAETLSALGLDAVVNLSASPFHRGKFPERISILQKACATLNAPMLYCNLVGGQDELVFDGGSLVLDKTGNPVASAKRFAEDLLISDIQGPAHAAVAETSSPEIDQVIVSLSKSDANLPSIPPRKEPPLSELEEVYRALCLGLRDYTDKNGFNQVLIAISGGIDSALVAVAAVDALGPDRVSGISLPTRYSSDGTRNDAIELAKNLGIDMPMLPIQNLFEDYLTLLQPLWPGKDVDVTEENLQARIRGTIVMAMSNKFGRLVVATGNKSEMATGYATLYGDMCGGYALIKDVPKTMVFDLCRWINDQAGTDRIPVSLIERPPSAELRDDQKDSDSLPPYDILDAILASYIEQDLGRDEIVADGFDPHTVTRVIRLVDGNEYKRRQSPPGVKITPKAFGRDRRVPITNQFRPTPPTPQKT